MTETFKYRGGTFVMRAIQRMAIAGFVLVSSSFAALSQGSPQSQPVVGIIEEKAAACDSPCNRTAVIFIHGIGGVGRHMEERRYSSVLAKLAGH